MNDSTPGQRLTLKEILLTVVWPSLLTLLLYLTGLRGELVYDDELLLVWRPRLMTVTVREAFTTDFWQLHPTMWQSMHYRPLALLFYRALYRTFGMDPIAFHAVDALLMALATAAFFFVLAGLGFSRRICLAASLLFAVYPLHVEAGAWISGMMETLVVTLCLISIACFVWDQLFASMVFAGIGMLVKETSLIIPALIFCIVWWRDNRKGIGIGRTLRDAIIAVLPFIPLAAAYMVARSSIIPPGFQEAFRTAMVNSPKSTMPMVVTKYMGLLFCPWPLALSYLPVELAWCWAALAILIAWGFFLWKNPAVRADLLLCTAWIALTLAVPVIASPLMQEGIRVQDRYAFLASGGVCLLVVLALEALPQLWRTRAFWTACMVLVPLGAALTLMQIPVWKSNETLWARALEIAPSNLYATTTQIRVLVRNKRLAQGRALIEKGLYYHPRDTNIHVLRALLANIE